MFGAWYKHVTYNIKSLLMLSIATIIALPMFTACSFNQTGGESTNSNTPTTTERIFVSQSDAEQYKDDYFVDYIDVSAAELDDEKTGEYADSEGLSKIGANHFHARNFTGKGQIIAVIDTPIHIQHGDLRDSFINGYDASNGQSDNIAASCFNDCDVSHGTHIAGIITANKNGQNVMGVAYDAKIKPISIFDDQGDSDVTAAQFHQAIIQASGRNIVAMNNSWNSTAYSQIDYNGTTYYYARAPGNNFLNLEGDIVNHRMSRSENLAWRHAIGQGTIAVFANGNHGLNSLTGMVALYDNKNLEGKPTLTKNASDVFGEANANIPSFRGSYAAIDEAFAGRWLTVIAVDDKDKITDFSNGCGIAKQFCLAAPGFEIESTFHHNGYEFRAGTSVAAPYVSGSIALLKQAFPSLAPEEIVALLLHTATDLGEDGVDDVYGHGMINLREALRPQGVVQIVGFDNHPLVTGDLLNQSGITFASHFGTNKNPLQTGVRDDYNRPFVAVPAQIIRADIEFNLSDYMQHFVNAHATEQVTLSNQTILSFNQPQQAQQQWLLMKYSLSQKHKLTASHHNDYKYQAIEQVGVVAAGTYFEKNNPPPIQPQFAYIRPSGKDVMQFSSIHHLSQKISIQPYMFTGDYDIGNKFEEIGVNISVYHQQSHVTLGYGRLDEHQQFLGTQSFGAYAIRDQSHTGFTDITITQFLFNHSTNRKQDGADNIVLHQDKWQGRLKRDLLLHLNYTDYRTDVSMAHQDFVSIANLAANRYQIGVSGNHLLRNHDKFAITFTTKFGIRTGVITQNSVQGYRTDGSFYNVTQHYSLAAQYRHRQLNATYQTPLNEYMDLFTTIAYDDNYQHQAGLHQTTLLTGIKATF
ncbi:MAG: S8 family serine peptidase [Alphaproteobacteria bacterium]|nr:S8 family serine peptidase [Alphaproteobacteria bacterium]